MSPVYEYAPDAKAMIVIVGAANAVNLTDGLDGLAIMPVMIAGATLGVIAYVVGNIILTNYLFLHHVPRSGELLTPGPFNSKKSQFYIAAMTSQPRSLNHVIAVSPL